MSISSTTAHYLLEHHARLVEVREVDVELGILALVRGEFGVLSSVARVEFCNQAIRGWRFGRWGNLPVGHCAAWGLGPSFWLEVFVLYVLANCLIPSIMPVRFHANTPRWSIPHDFKKCKTQFIQHKPFASFPSSKPEGTQQASQLLTQHAIHGFLDSRERTEISSSISHWSLAFTHRMS